MSLGEYAALAFASALTRVVMVTGWAWWVWCLERGADRMSLSSPPWLLLALSRECWSVKGVVLCYEHGLKGWGLGLGEYTALAFAGALASVLAACCAWSRLSGTGACC